MPTNEEIIAGIGEGLPVGVWVARAPSGEFVHANQKFREIMGIQGLADVKRGEYAEPYKIYDRQGAVYAEEKMPFVLALEAKETVMVDDIVIHVPDGQRVFVRAYARSVLVDDEISHVVVAFFDISREVQAEAMRADYEARLHQSQRIEALGKLAGGIAHDFNNLLAAIRLIASSLSRTEEDDDRKEQLDTIDEVTQTATNLTRALLSFAGGGKNLATPTSVNLVITSVESIVRRELDKQIELSLELNSDSYVAGDQSRLEQLVMNLALNGRDAMPDGGKLTIRTEESGDHVLIEVEDDGAGVPVELRRRIFEPFFTTKKAAKPSSAGLGLATAFGIVESHGGSIEIHDAASGGALFRVRLPTVVPRLVSPPAARSELVMGTGLILVVDDERILRESTIEALVELGYQAIGAEDGLVAVGLFRQRHEEIAAVLLDMTMPRLDGRGTYLALRQIDPEVRVLLTTGYALNEQAQQILDLGVRGFIEKPWNVQGLSAALAEVLA